MIQNRSYKSYHKIVDVFFKLEVGSNLDDLLVHNWLHDVVQQLEDHNLPLFDVHGVCKSAPRCRNNSVYAYFNMELFSMGFAVLKSYRYVKTIRALNENLNIKLCEKAGTGPRHKFYCDHQLVILWLWSVPISNK